MWVLRENVCKYQATGGHSQNLVFAKIWFVDRFVFIIILLVPWAPNENIVQNHLNIALLNVQ